MATDHATPVDSETADAETTAYVSPAVDFVLLFASALAVLLSTAVVIVP
ncbi:hypothetical protein [Natronomonas marina]|jgi:hypothetical protein|nr:hypothetical protein [Natronomonas marina]